jgi:16S rRNA (guanine527-N7)-methyltransferase
MSLVSTVCAVTVKPAGRNRESSIYNLQSTIYNPMQPSRIAELLQPFLEPAPEDSDSAVLLPSQRLDISTYIDLLLRWNSRVNLTSVRRPEEIVTRHFGESLFAARHLFPAPGRIATEKALPEVHVIDIGSGAGFPGLPIKIWAPHIRITLIESNHKKVTFLREVVRALALTNIDVLAGRAEDYPTGAGGGDVVTLRAVERFDSVVPAAAGLLSPAGRLAILIGQVQIERAIRLAPSIHWGEPIRLPMSSSRFMIIGNKESGQ